MLNRSRAFRVLTFLAAAGAAHARVKNPDIASLHDVTLNSRIVVQGTITKIDVPRLVVTLSIDKLWHGELVVDPATGQVGTQVGDQEITYECRGSIDAFRVSKHVIEFIEPNVPYGTQDPKTLRAPWRPKSVRNRVFLDDPDGKDYAAFVLRYLDLSQADRGRAWSSALQEHLVSGLEAKDDRTRQAAGESLRDLLTTGDLHGQPARELLTPEAKAAIIRVLEKADGQAGPPVMKLAATLGDPQIAPAMVHGVLYLPQSGVERTDAIGKALNLAKDPTEKAIDTEYASARTDAWREYLIQDMTALAGPSGEKFLWELVTKEKRAALRKEALLGYINLGDPAVMKNIVATYRKEPEASQAELVPKIAARGADAKDFVRGELKSPHESVRRAAARVCPDLGIADGMAVLQDVLSGCLGQEDPGFDCLAALSALRRMESPEAIQILRGIEANEKASPKLKEDAHRYLEDVPSSGSGQ
ncbi:MAG: hypothetical protein U0166_09035 [Acidobacteriota bacterium]